jgi:hypothetical protein
MVEILRKIFEEKPKKSTIAIKGSCSDCGCETTVEVTATSEGFGLLGGVLFRCSPDGYLMRCETCCSRTKK